MTKKSSNKKKNAKPVSKSTAKKLKGGDVTGDLGAGAFTCNPDGCSSGTPKTRCYNDY